MPDLGPAAEGLGELLAPLLRSALGAFFRTAAGMLLLGLAAAGLSARLAWTASPLRALLGVIATLAIFAVLGGLLIAKRAIGGALIDGLRRFGLGRRLTDLVFGQMLGIDGATSHGERGGALAQTVERLPLAEAEARLGRAIQAITAPKPGVRQRWLARAIERRLIHTVERVTLARFRAEAAASGGVDLVKVQRELGGWIDTHLADSLGAKLNAVSFGLASLACALSVGAALLIRHLPGRF